MMTETQVAPGSGGAIPRRAAGLFLERSGSADRRFGLLALGMGLPWMAYTRLYFWLHPRGLTTAPSLFMHLTGRPDPLCGLTRTFAWMWRGDVLHAMLAYPLGPAIFAVFFPFLGYAGFVVTGSPAVRVRLPTWAGRAILAVVVLLIAANWTAKLLWLGV